MRSIRFNIFYFLATILLFFIEVMIATVLKNNFFIRAYLGDVIVVILLFTFVKSFCQIENVRLITGIFVFSCLIETAQHFKAADLLGFAPESIPYIVVGNSFSWIDILCYAAGCLLLVAGDFIMKSFRRPN
jgi:hypothetical protein